MEKKWFILYTKPGTEKKVVASLAKKRIEHYLPMCYKGGDNNMTGKRAKEPLFEGYVFVETTADELMGIQKSVGALSVVYWKGEVVIVSNNDITSLKNFVPKHHIIEIVQTDKSFDSQSPGFNSTSFVGNEDFAKINLFPDQLRLSTLGNTLIAGGVNITKIQSCRRNLQGENLTS